MTPHEHNDEFAELAMFTFRSMTRALEEKGVQLSDDTMRRLPGSIAMTFDLYWRGKQLRARREGLAA